MCALTLMLLGLAAIVRAEELLGGEGSWQRQAVWMGISLAAMLLVALPSYRVLGKFSYLLYLLAIVLLVAVLFTSPVNGARRWLRMGPIGFQPSEFAKLALVLCLARYLMFRDNHRRLLGWLAPLAICLVPMLLIVKEPDLGTTLLFPPVCLAMLFAAGAKLRHLAVVALAGAMLAPVVWTQMSREQRSRITALLESTSPGVRPSGDAYHLYRSKQTLALGGAWGSVLSEDDVSEEGLHHLPAAKTDFIFCILGERFGLAGTGGVLLLHLLLAWRGLAVATQTRDPFGRLVAVGIVSLLAVQTCVNTAMTVGLAPITGLTLPLVSYGGSSLLAASMGVGLLLNIGLRPGFDVTNEPFRFVERPSRRARAAV